MNPSDPVAAGAFGAWLEQARESLRGHTGADVPCGDCVGCCVSSYFIPVRDTDAGARARIPSEVLVEASGQPGQLMMGYRHDGTCPMLVDRKCSIYAHRPQTCRDYDCRIFAAAGIDAGGPDKVIINTRVRAWRFTYADETDRRTHDAVRAAATFIRDKREAFPQSRAPTAPTGIAVLAVKVYEVFLRPDVSAERPEDTALAIIAASRAFDATMRDAQRTGKTRASSETSSG